MPDKTTLPEPAPDGQVLIYQDGATHLQVRLEGRTVWLSQRLIAELFQVSVKTANEHLVNIYSERELDPEATIRSFRIVQTEGSREVTGPTGAKRTAKKAVRKVRPKGGWDE